MFFQARSGSSFPLLATMFSAMLLVACKNEPGAQPTVTPTAEEQPAASSLSVEGSGFVLKLADGRVLRGTELAGATVYLAMEGNAVAPVKLASIVPDPERLDILRHDFQAQDAQGAWVPACQPNADGERWGFPVSLPEGHPGREGDITISCASGAVVKCARWGYPTWGKGPKGEDLVPLHAACVHMVRADYCGDGVAHTKDGTSIDYWDDFGMSKRGAEDDRAFVFESGWSPQGAVCVNHTRWSDLLTREDLQAQCPRLAAMPLCSEASARAAGALLFNASRLLPAKN